ncbi:hypothetical protein ACOL3H_07015 [Aliarcobacter butzleri]
MEIIRKVDSLVIKEDGYSGQYDDTTIIYATSTNDCEEAFNHMSAKSDEELKAFANNIKKTAQF